jgi:hypothetical protein
MLEYLISELLKGRLPALFAGQTAHSELRLR